MFDRGSSVRSASIVAGQIGRLWGLGDVRIGDVVGAASTTANGHHFAPPTLEAVVVPRRRADNGALHAALAQLAEQDPLINLRQDDVRQEIFVSLYGEVQKEVVQETLATDFDLDVEFRDSTTICIERPIRSADAIEIMGMQPNPFLARSDCASTRRHSIPASSSGTRSSSGRSRWHSTEPSRRPSARRSAKGSTAGRSPTAW